MADIGIKIFEFFHAYSLIPVRLNWDGVSRFGMVWTSNGTLCSASPLVGGWSGATNFWEIPCTTQYDRNSSLEKAVVLSETSIFG